MISCASEPSLKSRLLFKIGSEVEPRLLLSTYLLFRAPSWYIVRYLVTNGSIALADHSCLFIAELEEHFVVLPTGLALAVYLLHVFVVKNGFHVDGVAALFLVVVTAKHHC